MAHRVGMLVTFGSIRWHAVAAVVQERHGKEGLVDPIKGIAKRLLETC